MSGSDADLSGGIHCSCMRHRIQIGATGTLSRRRGNIPEAEGSVKVRSNLWIEPHIARRPVTDVPTCRRPTIRGVNPRASVFSSVEYSSVRHQVCCSSYHVSCDLLRGCGTHRR